MIPEGAQITINMEYNHLLSRLRITQPNNTPMRQAQMWKEGAEFGCGLIQQQIADREKERLYWQQLAEAGAKVIQQYERTGCNYETDSYKIWQQLKNQKP